MKLLHNPYVSAGMPDLDGGIPFPSINSEKPAALLKSCPVFGSTPLVRCRLLAKACGVAGLDIKDERGRFGLGSFKALGAAYVIASDAVATASESLDKALEGVTYVTASAGNHGLSVASGAATFGARAVIYLSQNVSESFAERLRQKQAIVVRQGQNYEESMQGAQKAAETNGWRLLSDSSWPGYFDVPHRLMEGYLQLANETAGQLENPPSHIFLQAGVGGFAAAIAAFARHRWGEKTKIVIVEPSAAPALQQSVEAGRAVITSGPVSCMGRLDCKQPSLIALKGLARDADYFVTITDEEVAAMLPLLDENELTTTPSGAAGLAALFTAQSRQNELELTPHSTVLAFITEGMEP